MSDIIAEYQRWNQQGGDLRAKAKTAMETRFRELLLEAARLAAARKKLESAQAAGTPTRDIDDKIYEIEDALRLARSSDV